MNPFSSLHQFSCAEDMSRHIRKLKKTCEAVLLNRFDPLNMITLALRTQKFSVAEFNETFDFIVNPNDEVRGRAGCMGRIST